VSGVGAPGYRVCVLILSPNNGGLDIPVTILILLDPVECMNKIERHPPIGGTFLSRIFFSDRFAFAYIKFQNISDD